MSFKHKLAAGLAALGVLASLSGCTLGKSFDYAAKVGEVEISSGLYLYYQYASYLDAAEQSQKNPKEVKTVLKEQIGEQSATDYIKAVSYTHLSHLGVWRSLTGYHRTAGENNLRNGEKAPLSLCQMSKRAEGGKMCIRDSPWPGAATRCSSGPPAG